MERVRDAQVKKLGEEASATLLTIQWLANAYEKDQQLEKAEACLRKWLTVTRRRVGVDAPNCTTALGLLGWNLLQQKKYRDAEPVLREFLDLSRKLAATKRTQTWQIANIKSWLGEALVGEKKLAEAAPLLVEGYHDMKANETAIPEVARQEVLSGAIKRLIDLATAEKKPDDVKKWQAELVKYKVPQEDKKTTPKAAATGP